MKLRNLGFSYNGNDLASDQFAFVIGPATQNPSGDMREIVFPCRGASTTSASCGSNEANLIKATVCMVGMGTWMSRRSLPASAVSVVAGGMDQLFEARYSHEAGGCQ
jgi:hypothetical protein